MFNILLFMSNFPNVYILYIYISSIQMLHAHQKYLPQVYFGGVLFVCFAFGGVGLLVCLVLVFGIGSHFVV